MMKVNKFINFMTLLEQKRVTFKKMWEESILEILNFRTKKVNFNTLSLPKEQLIKKAPLLIEKITKLQFKSKLKKCQWGFFSGANGVGKNTVLKLVMEKIKAKKLPYAYTRARRPDEIDGIDYYFWNNQQFNQALQKNEFIWYDLAHHGKKQGLLRQDLMNRLKTKDPFVLDARVSTTKILTKEVEEVKNSNYISFYILPPSFDEWYRRLTTRSTDSPKENVLERIEISLEELKNSKNICEVFIVNDQVERAVQEIIKFYL
jgi:guanylate kinase